MIKWKGKGWKKNPRGGKKRDKIKLKKEGKSSKDTTRWEVKVGGNKKKRWI